MLGSHMPACHRRMVIATQFNVLPCCTATQTSSVPLHVAFDCALAISTSGSACTHHPPTVPVTLQFSLCGSFLLSSLLLCGPLSLCVCLTLSLSRSLSASHPLHPPKALLFLLTLRMSFFFLLTYPTFSLFPSLPRVSGLSYPPLCLLAHFRHVAACFDDHRVDVLVSQASYPW